MKHLLEHLRNELEKQLVDGAARNQKLQYIYEDMLDKIERALEELSGSVGFEEENTYADDSGKFPSSFTGSDFDELAQSFEELTGKDIRKAGKVIQKLRQQDAEDLSEDMEKNDIADEFNQKAGIGEEDNQFKETGGEHHKTRDEEDYDEKLEDMGRERHHAMRDGSKETFEELKQNLESFGVDIDTLRDTDDLDEEELTELAFSRALEKVNSIEDGHPELFRRIARLSEQKEFQEEMEEQKNEKLIDWAVGNREIDFKQDKQEIANQIREILDQAREEADGTKSLLETFEESIVELLVDVRSQPEVEPEVKTETEEDSHVGTPLAEEESNQSFREDRPSSNFQEMFQQ